MERDRDTETHRGIGTLVETGREIERETGKETDTERR